MIIEIDDEQAQELTLAHEAYRLPNMMPLDTRWFREKLQLASVEAVSPTQEPAQIRESVSESPGGQSQESEDATKIVQ